MSRPSESTPDSLEQLRARVEALELRCDGQRLVLETMLPDEIRRDASGALDEVVVRACTFHLEQMSKRAWWIGLSKGKNVAHIWIRASKKGRLTVEVTEDGLGCWDHLAD